MDTRPRRPRRGDFIELTVRGGVWRVIDRLRQGGIDGEDLLTLEWVGGCLDPGRICKFSSGQARVLTEMEVIALSAL